MEYLLIILLKNNKFLINNILKYVYNNLNNINE